MKRKLPEPMAGEIWDVRLDPVVGAEQGGIRPVLVISSDCLNLIQRRLYFIVPITRTDRILAYQINLSSREGELIKNFVSMCDQARSATARRFRLKRSEVAPSVPRSVHQMVGRLIDAHDRY